MKLANAIFRLRIVALGLIYVGCSTAFAVISPDPITGKYYELETSAMTWDEARVDAKNRFFGGQTGHLVTISDLRENLVVQHIGTGGDRWIGLTDSTAVSMIDGFDLSSLGTVEHGNTSGLPLPAPGLEPVSGQRGAGFRWVTQEPYTFQHWRAGAPADFAGMADGVHTIIQGHWQDNAAGVTVGQPGLQHTIRPFVTEYETQLQQAKFNFVERRAGPNFNGNGTVVTVAHAEALLRLPSTHPDVAQEVVEDPYVISFHDPDLGVGFNDVVRAPFGTNVVGQNDEFLAFRATAMVDIPSAGDWTFGVAAGDVYRLRVGENEFSGAGIQPSTDPRLTQSTSGTLTAAAGGSGDTFYFPAPGTYRLELTALESTFFAFVQLFAAPGNHSSFDLANFDLVGDKLNGGLNVAEVVGGDFTTDGLYNCSDINLLVAEVVAALNDPLFDLNADGLVNLLDIDEWLMEAGVANLGPGKAYLPGDANLDGLVNGQDFEEWNDNKFTEVAEWCSGDFNADGLVNGQDFLIWNANKFTTSDAAPLAIPEPTVAISLLMLVALILPKVTSRRRRFRTSTVGPEGPRLEPR